MNKDSLSKTTVLEVLNRLSRQYDDHMRSTIRNIRGYDDLQLLAANAIVASRWEAKQDAVKTVAEYLGVVLGPLENEKRNRILTEITHLSEDEGVHD